MNEACLGQLFWEDGSDFDVYPTGVTMNFAVGDLCARIHVENDDIETHDANDCAITTRRFICNYKCTEGEVVSYLVCPGHVSGRYNGSTLYYIGRTRKSAES